MTEPLSKQETLKWCKGCPLENRKYVNGCQRYTLRWPQWPRWDGEPCPARETVESEEEELSEVAGGLLSRYRAAWDILGAKHRFGKLGCSRWML